MRRETYYRVHRSPLGDLLLTSDGEALTGIYMEGHRGGVRPEAHWIRDDAPFMAARAQLSAYFGGERIAFDVPVAPRGTPFQARVWQALLEIPYGQTISYAELARRIGNPRAVRAVGAANGRNPVSIFVPCHRVIAHDGALTGYGGGLWRKRWLLHHEGAEFRDDPAPGGEQTALSAG